MARACRGDRDAWHDLWPTLAPSVVRVASRLLARQEVEDAVQETAVEIWRSMGSFRGQSLLKTWVHSVTVRTCLGIRERQRRHSDAMLRLFQGREKTRLSPSASRLAEDKEVRRIVRQCLSDLGSAERHTLTLRYLQEMTHRRVADVLGCSEEAAKKRCHRARQYLREAFERRFSDGGG